MEHWLQTLFGGKNIFDPMSDPKFYYHYAHKDRDGLYIFGDNIARLSDGRLVIRDISMSEILQAQLRQGDEGECLVWFPWLEGTDRQGPSGDPFTTNWNAEGIEGLRVIWEEDPGLFYDDAFGLTDVIEDTDAFLGMAWTTDGRLVNKGMKLTVDDADRRIPVFLRPRGWNNLQWGPERVDLARALQTVIAYGLCDEVDLVWFYDRIKPDQDWLADYYLEYPSASDRIEMGLKDLSILDEALEMVGRQRLLDWWPKLEMELMRKQLESETYDETRPNSSSDGDTPPDA
jgi:hypothetical protein